MDPAVPLVIPEINAEAIGDHRGIIANPNCSTIIAITPLWPIHRQNRIRRLIIAPTRRPPAPAPRRWRSCANPPAPISKAATTSPRVLPHPYAFNLFSHNTKIDPATGYNDEETKVINETRKIFGDPDIRVAATCVRVPVLRAHAVAVTFECERPIAPAEVRDILAGAPGVRIVDDPERNYFPMPKDASGQDDILVGRIRRTSATPAAARSRCSRRRPAAERRRAQRRPDRGAAAALNDSSGSPSLSGRE